MADKLLEKEVIFKEDLIEIFGKRRWDKEEDYTEPVYAEESQDTDDNESENGESTEEEKARASEGESADDQSKDSTQEKKDKPDVETSENA